MRTLSVCGLLLCAMAPANAQEITGVIGGYGALDYEYEYGGIPDIEWRGTGFGGWAELFGKVGVVISDDLTVQLDAWARTGAGKIDLENTPDGGETWDPDYTYDWAQKHFGTMAHVTFRSGDFLYGLAGGLGAFSGTGTEEPFSFFATGALEGGYQGDAFSLIGQIGLTQVLAGPHADYDSASYHAGVDAVYYLAPDFSVSASGSIAHSNDYYEDYTYTVLSTEARYKLPDSPLILSAAYMLEIQEYGAVAGNYTAFANRAMVGARIPFGAGAETLQDLDRATGLKTYADYYGR